MGNNQKLSPIFELPATVTLMLKSPIVFLLFILFGCSQPNIPTILADDYNCLLPDGEVTKIRQTKDTLYEFNCFIERPCNFIPETHYKIISSYKTGDFTILKLEWLDTIPLKDQFCPGKRFSITVLKNINKNQLSFIYPFHCLTRKQLDTTQITNLSLKDRPFFTYFGDTYLKELSAFKKVSTKSAVKEVINAIENNNFDAGKISFTAEQLNWACIEKGYNPVGARLTIDSIMKLH